MRLLFFADIHADPEWADYIASRCGDCDLLVLGGDLMNQFSRVPYHEQAKALTRWLIELKAPAVVVITGNHDWWTAKGVSIDAKAEGRWIRNLRGQGRIVGVDGDVVVVGGLKFFLHGWLAKLDLNQRADILVTHAPPAGTGTATAKNGQDYGNPDLLGIMHMPRLILSGHVHSPKRYCTEWRSTVVLNPGCDEDSSEPLHWVVNTQTGIATHSRGDVAHFDGSLM